MIEEFSKQSEFIKKLMSYGFTAPVETRDIEIFNDLHSAVMKSADPNSKVFKQFGTVESYIEFVKHNLEIEPSETLLALYESTVIDPFNEAMTMGNIAHYSNAQGAVENSNIKQKTANFAKGAVMYSALGLLGKGVKKNINMESIVSLIESIDSDKFTDKELQKELDDKNINTK